MAAYDAYLAGELTDVVYQPETGATVPDLLATEREAVTA